MTDISFELARFEWVSPDRLEVEGTWHGVRRWLARATLVVEVDGRRHRLRALPEDAGSPGQWTAAFAWDGEAIPRLSRAELEVGRSIVVDLPRPRRSKARGASAAKPQPQPPIPATTRAERKTDPRDEAEFEALHARAEESEAELTTLRARADESESERAAAHARAEESEAELTAVRSRAEESEAELTAVRSRAEESEAELTAVRARVEEAEGEAASLRAGAEEAEAAVASLQAEADEKPAAVAPDVARLRVELESVERERGELRAQLDSTAERLETATRRAVTAGGTQPLPPPSTTAGGSAPAGEQDAMDARQRRFTQRRFNGQAPAGEPANDINPRHGRRPAERTAKRTADPPSRDRPALAGKLTDWVGSVVGGRDDGEASENGETNGEGRAGPRRRAKPAPDSAADAPPTARAAQAVMRTRRRVAPRQPPADRREQPSWPLRVVAIALLALLLVALVLIVASIA